MIEAFLKRRIIRQFLNTYSEDQWKDLIPDIFEIAVLSLQRSFNKILFTKDELKDILEDLRDSDYYKTIQPKKIEKLTKHKSDIDSRNSTLHQHSQTEVPSKPLPNKPSYPYPSWWHDEQEHALREEIEHELQQQKPHRKHKSKQHFNQSYNYHKHSSKSKPKKVFEPKLYERMHNPSESNSTYSNYTYTETDYSYDKRLVLNKLTKAQSKNQYEPKSKTTYKISYDKNLQPQSIEEKTKEGSRGSERIDKRTSKDKMQGSLSSRNGYQYDSYHERRTMSTKGDNTNNKEQSNQGSRYESRQHSNQQSRHTSQTHSLLQSQEIAPQTIPNQQQYMPRPQMQVQGQYQQPINQQYHYADQQRVINQGLPYMQNQQYMQGNDTQTHQYIQSEPIYEEHYEQNPQMIQQHKNEKQYEQVQMYQNVHPQYMKHQYLNKQSSSSQEMQERQSHPIITDGQDMEETSQHNKSIRKQTSQSEVQESQSIKQHQIIQSQEELPLETKELIIEETNNKVEKQTYEINKHTKPPEQKLPIHKNPLQQSNSSETRQPGEQLSMIEVNDDLRNLFKTQLSNAHLSRKSGSSDENKQLEDHISPKTQSNNIPYNLPPKNYE